MASAITIDGKEILVSPPKYPSNEFKEVLGARYDKGRKMWRLSPTAMNMMTVRDWFGDGIFQGAPWVVKNLAMSDWGFSGWGVDNREQMERAHDHPHWDDLYDFQKEAVEYMCCNPHNGSILALSPGLGKSLTSIVAADVLESSRILILAPLTLAKNWLKEWDKWASMYRSWSRATRSEKDPKTECVVTNHETMFEVWFEDEDGEQWEYPPLRRKHVLPADDPNGVGDYSDGDSRIIGAIRGGAAQKKWIQQGPHEEDKKGKMVPVRKRVTVPRETYSRVEWDIIIIDESVLLKNRKALKVDIAGELAKYAHQVWLLSGSPTSKFRTDLYPQVKTIMPRGFRSYWRFAEFFCTIDKNQWGWKINGDRPDHDPKEYLKDILFVRNQKDVLPELPDYIYDPIEVELNLDQQKAFKGMTEDWAAEIEAEVEEYGNSRVTAEIALAQMTRLQQITSNMVNLGAKRSSAKEDLLMTLLAEEDIELPLLVWCWFVPTAQSVYDRLYDGTDLDVDVVTGNMKAEDKDEALEDFHDGELDVLVCQMGVGKFGHNLQRTRTVYYHDRSFDSDAYIQSLRRVRRIGLKHRPRLIVPRAPFSADPIVEENLAGKMQSVAKLANHDLQELLRALGTNMIPWSLERYDDVEGWY